MALLHEKVQQINLFNLCFTNSATENLKFIVSTKVKAIAMPTTTAIIADTNTAYAAIANCILIDIECT